MQPCKTTFKHVFYQMPTFLTPGKVIGNKKVVSLHPTIYSPLPPPPSYPTAECFAFLDSCLLLLGSRSRRHLPKLRLRPQRIFLETEADFETTSLALKFYPQKLQKLFCAKMRFLMFEQRQPISLFWAQLFVNKLFRLREKKMPYYAV